MAPANRELEAHLLDAGRRLLRPPSSADELLPLLDRVESFLSMVEQSPSRTMLNNLSPTMKALVTDEYLQNPNEDVKVAAASCISEITRITAPDAPYDDEQMKKVFQLIVSSFENLSDKSSHSYSRRILILETVAKVRSCVVMLDLECDGLIVEMFQHFLKAIRDHHPKNIFSSMETIMTLVLEESEDVALDLISPLLASLKRDNQDVWPIAQKLAENVFRNCSAKIKPCLIEAKSSQNFSFDDYNPIISKICKGTSHVAEHDNHLSSEEPLDQGTKEIITETLSRRDHHAPVETGSYEHHAAPVDSGPGKDHSAPMETGDHPAFTGPGEGHHACEIRKSVTSNGIAETKNEDAAADPYSLERIEHTNKGRRSPDANVADPTGSGDADCRKIAKVVPKSAQSKKRSRKPRHSIKSAVPFESSHIDTDEENRLITEVDRNPDKKVHVSPSKDPSSHVVVHKENQKETKQVSPSPSGSVLEEGHSQKDLRSRKKKKFQEESPSENAATKKASEVTELKLRGRSGKKTFASDTPLAKAHVLFKKSKVEDGPGSISNIKVAEKSAKKVDPEGHIGVGSSSKKKTDGQRRVKGQTTLEKDPVSSPKPSKIVKDASPLQEAPKRSSKRKSTTSKEKVTDVKQCGEDMIGARVKVWWPLDKMYATLTMIDSCSY